MLSVVLFVAFAFAPLGAGAHRRAAPSPAPSPTVTPTPVPMPVLSPQERDARLRDALNALAQGAPGRLGVSVIDLARDERVSVHGDDAFPLASVVKLPVALAAFRRADQGRFDLDARVLVTAADLRRGISPIARDHPLGNVWLSNLELLRAMLVDSDDTACDVLLGELGGPQAIDTLLDNLGLRGFAIRRTEADLSAEARGHKTFARGGDNAGTPNGVADLLAHLVEKGYLGEDRTAELMLLLSQVQTGQARLRAGLPPDAALLHETGTSDTFDGATDATNDAGVVTLPGGRRIVIVAFLAQSHATPEQRDATLARAASLAYAAFVP
jgi:beta-lactamase class A